MIPTADILAWRNEHPWVSNAQVEQDLIICRAVIELFARPVLREQLAFRGGTALHKLFLKPAICKMAVHSPPHEISSSWLQRLHAIKGAAHRRVGVRQPERAILAAVRRRDSAPHHHQSYRQGTQQAWSAGFQGLRELR